MPNVIMLSDIMPNVIMLKVIMLKVIMLNVIKLSDIMLNVIMLKVVMLSVVAPINDISDTCLTETPIWNAPSSEETSQDLTSATTFDTFSNALPPTI
jgi:hypothetical protein